LIDQRHQYSSSRLTVILFFVLTLVTSGSAYAFVTGNLDPNFNSVFATSSNSDGGKGGGSSASDNDGSSGDSDKKSKSSSGDSGGGGGSSDNGGSSGGSDGGGSGSSTSTSPSATEQNTAITPPYEIGDRLTRSQTSQVPDVISPPQTLPQICPDGSLPDANGNCPTPSGQQQLQQHLQSRPPQKIDDGFTSFSSKLPTTPDSVSSLERLHTKVYDFLNRSKSSQVPDVIPTLNPDSPSSKNTGVAQPIQTDKTSNLLGPRSSQLQRTPDSVLTQKPKSNVGDLLTSPSSDLQTRLSKTTTTQKAPDTLFKGPKSVPGSIPLGNPATVPAPNEEGARSADDPCIAVSYEECNFPYPISQDEICRNGIDDDRDGKVDEAYPCSEVPGESKPRPSDGILTPTPGQPLGP
jgi:hypothetical protein